MVVQELGSTLSMETVVENKGDKGQKSCQIRSPETVVYKDGMGDTQPNNSKGGWRAMPFIMGNELCDRLVESGVKLNLMSYLTKEYNIRQVTGVTVLNLSFGTTSLTPVLVAYISDAYLGRFWAVVFACIFNLLGSLFLTISAVSKSLRPAPSQRASGGQLAFLFMAFLFNAIGAGGLRSCTSAFGADQFNQISVSEQKKGPRSFFNWYFFFTYIGTLLGATVLVYIQENVGWGWGYGVPTVATFVALSIFVLGYPFYRHESLMGSPFSGLAQVVVASFHKRNLPLPSNPQHFYDVSNGKSVLSQCKLRHTKKFMYFDHAAIKTRDDFGDDGEVLNPWRLCTVTQVEELKGLVKLIPICISSLASATALSAHLLFNVAQANSMDRYVGRYFQIPAASLPVFASFTLLTWVPVYDRIVVPIARRLTGHHRGIKMLQRIGIGFFISMLELIVSALVEGKRRHAALINGFIDKPHSTVPISVFWLVPQFCLHGLGECFWAIGQLEFFYDQLPAKVRSMAGATYWLILGVGHYIGTVILQIVHKVTDRQGHEGWLGDNLNRCHLDYFFYLLAGLQFINLFFFVTVSMWYIYQDVAIENKEGQIPDESDSFAGLCILNKNQRKDEY